MIIKQAAKLAFEMHKGQFRKHRREPYFNHLARVASRFMVLPGADEIHIAAAYMHDIVEDTPMTFDELRSLMGREVTDIVWALTNESMIDEKLAGEKRAVRKKADHKKIGRQSYQVKAIKLCDRWDNLMSFRLDSDPFMYKYASETLDLIKEMKVEQVDGKCAFMIQFILKDVQAELDTILNH